VKDGKTKKKKEAKVSLRHATGTADRQGSASEVGKAMLDIGLDWMNVCARIAFYAGYGYG
jgi:hypothetical protein